VSQRPLECLADLICDRYFFPLSPSCQNHPHLQRDIRVRFDLTYQMLSVTLTAARRRWEFFTTLDFEWEVFTGKRPWKWSFAVYLTARMLALTSVILNFIGFNLTSRFNCNVSRPLERLFLAYTRLTLHRHGSVVYSFPRGFRSPSPRSYLCFVGM